MIIDWLHAGPTMLASFLASFVEFVEALTVVLAVGTVRGWRDALGGSGAALLALLVIIAVLGPALTRIHLESVQLVVGGGRAGRGEAQREPRDGEPAEAAGEAAANPCCRHDFSCCLVSYR